MSNFTPEAARARPGPGWLIERRLAAAERFASATMPTPSEEAWRYSRIEELDLERFTPADRASSGSGALRSEPAVLAGSVLIHSLNGAIISIELDEALEAKGVVVADLATLAEAPAALGQAADASPDAFLHLHDAFMAGGVYISVPAGVFIEAPIVVEHRFEGDGIASFPRTVLVVGEDGEASLLERFIPAGPGAQLVVPVTEIVIGDAARVSYLGLQDHNPSTWQIALQRSLVGKQATLRSSAVALGGDYARLRVEALLQGEGASSEMVAVYFANESQMLDFRTLQDHDAPHTTSDLLFKGAVEDEARSVYSGLVRLRKTAQRANAAQTNRNLVLSEGAAAESIPNLEIEANDVRCSHASAVGPIDDDQLYYLQSRGLPPDVAERLIVFGFFEDVIERLPLPGLEEPLREAVAHKFEARRHTREEHRMAEVKVCSVDDLKPGSAKRFDIGGHRLAVVRIGDDGWYVIGDRCTHAEASIAEGEVWPDELEIECPKHGSAFSLVTGDPLTLPATVPVPVYTVRVDGNDVLVEVGP